MKPSTVLIKLDDALIQRLDSELSRSQLVTRDQFIQTAIHEKLTQLEQTKSIRFAQECAKLDPIEESAFAELGMSADQELWLDY